MLPRDPVLVDDDVGLRVAADRVGRACRQRAVRPFGTHGQRQRGASGNWRLGQFLGTLNYVAPEQIEGRPVDGRTDEYALACSAFEMLTGLPPFRRDESLAIMYAQLSSAPPSLTSSRPDLPAAADGVVAKALAKAPDDRYGTCLEFAAALRRACGLGPGGTSPGTAAAGRAATRAVRPAELAAAAAAAAAGEASGQPPGQPAATGTAGAGQTAAGIAGAGQTAADVADAGAAETSVADTGRAGAGAAGAGQPGGGRADAGPGAGPPTQTGRVQGVGPARAGTTDPMGGFDQLYRPPGGPPLAPPQGPPTVPPRRRSRRRLTGIIAVCVVVAAAVGAYLLLGLAGGGGGGDGHSSAATPVLAPSACTTKTVRPGSPLKVHTGFVPVNAKPFDVAVTPNHFGFVSHKGGPLVVLNTATFTPSVLQTVFLTDSEGEAFTHDGQYLLVAGDDGMTVFRVSDLEAGGTAAVGSLHAPGGKGALQVVTSRDDHFAFVALQHSNEVAMFDLKKALTAGFGPADFIGKIPLRGDPTGMAASPDGRHLYVVNGFADTAIESGMGTLAIVDMQKAAAHPRSSVVATVNAGCGPARVIPSDDGKQVWVTVGGGNTLEAFSATKLIDDPKHALVAKLAVGQIPLGMVFIDNGARMVVANSNRDNIVGAVPGLAVIDVSKALAGEHAVVGTMKSRQAPRAFALEPDGKTLLVTNTGSGQVEAVNIGQLPR
jgi:DNA-binding beta-propeller fold protein YncE